MEPVELKNQIASMTLVKGLWEPVLDRFPDAAKRAPKVPLPTSPKTAVAGSAASSSSASVSATAGARSAEGVVDVLVSVKPPEGLARQPSDIVCVMDVSGSMGMEATIQSASGQTESHGLTLLDVAKHGLRTVANTLGEGDRMSLVAFNHTASIVFPLTVMDEAGRAKAIELINLLQPGGGTDIWEGLKSGLDLLPCTNSEGRFGHVMLLTDGESRDKDTIVTRLKAYEESLKTAGDNRVRLPGTINTFGFGYNLDSKLLVSLSTEGSGAYSFIPDAGFVGTAFVNMMAQLLVTYGRNLVVDLEKGDAGEIQQDKIAGGWDIKDEGSHYRVSLGTLQYGQSRDLVVPVKIPADCDEILGVAAEFETRGEPFKSGFVTASRSSASNDETAVEENVCRYRFVKALTDGMAATTLAFDDGAKAIADCGSAVRSSSAASTEFVKALLEDIGGQATEAFSRQDWYKKWGCHYLPSLWFAHKLQMCNNFKDPGIQNYGGSLFADTRDNADDVFNSLPAPTPSAPRRSVASGGYGGHAPVSMAAYNDRCAG
eukprot:TRINITY_DN37963_c0_g1_i1.p1 TRINITY_DN37963_c0_g1~~TRINITY_DN37963_c0_g1_i1.p1  ORF type:complete len:544 (-),score=140.79 TRINITY_DN37963_c0_g1_i1:181-1812(-)